MLTASILLIVAVLAVSYANGANDTFKGVATLYGSGAAITVFATALAGIPISTTHSLVGALTGAGLMASGSALNFAGLGQSFMLPLLLSPLLSVLLVATLYPSLSWLGTRLAVAGLPGRLAVSLVANERALRAMHFLSAGAVSFARGTNDAPKIVGVALAAQAIDAQISTVLIAFAMAVGGLMHSRPIAQTMAKRIVSFREAKGALANTVTSGLVVSATFAGLPVSTTHVSVGSLFGLAVTKGGADWRMIRTIVASWFLTLPTALIASALVYLAIRWGHLEGEIS